MQNVHLNFVCLPLWPCSCPVVEQCAAWYGVWGVRRESRREWAWRCFDGHFQGHSPRQHKNARPRDSDSLARGVAGKHMQVARPDLIISEHMRGRRPCVIKDLVALEGLQEASIMQDQRLFIAILVLRKENRAVHLCTQPHLYVQARASSLYAAPSPWGGWFQFSSRPQPPCREQGRLTPVS